MTFGLGLIAVSLWGIALCQRLFLAYIVGLGPTSLDKSFAALAGWGAWFLFFGPIGAVGFIVILSAVRKLRVLDRLRVLSEEWTTQEIPTGVKPQDLRSVRSEQALHDDLESLSDEEAAQLTKRGNQTAILLGIFAGVFFVLLGVFGLWFAAQNMPVRLTIDIAILSGICILAGLAVLQRTFRKENSAWLLPLKLFTLRVLRLHSAESHKARRSDHAQ